MRYKSQLIVSHRLLRMQVSILDQFQDISRLTVIMEVDSKFVIDMPETLNPAVFACCYNPSCLKKFRFAPADILRVIKLVISPVF